MVDLYKPARWLFMAFCFICLGYMIGDQIGKFNRNEDTSTISFKKLTSEKYPTYTLCFEGNGAFGRIYKTQYLVNGLPFGTQKKVF